MMIEDAQRIEFTGERAFHLYETFGLPLDFMMTMRAMLGIEFDQRASKLRARKSRPAPAHLGRAARKRRPARRFAICRRRFLKATGNSTRRTAKFWPL